MQYKEKETIRQFVRERYGNIAKNASVVSGISPAPSCCGQTETAASADPEPDRPGSGAQLPIRREHGRRRRREGPPTLA